MEAQDEVLIAEVAKQDDVLRTLWEEHQTFEEALATLPWREREILGLRYGLSDGESHSLEDIARIFKVSRERIR
ncbi:MAG: sigma factor-like helix-turn-helix DNA-binding protein, partial [Myxococcota bacterium]